MQRFWLMVGLSWGLSLGSAASAVWVPLDSNWRYFRGTSEASAPDATAWRQVGFSDTAWAEAPAPFWYGDRQPSPGTQLTDMQGRYTCVFLRRTFEVANVAAVENLELGAQSDDGFIAWINGNPVGRFNMPNGEIPYNGTSSPPLSEPISFQRINILNPQSVLRPGTNVLAVQAFNSSLSASSDFVINVSLQSSNDVSPPTVVSILPATNRVVAVLNQIEVLFSEPVTGVDAADLLLNNVAATAVVTLTPSDYLFTFPQPSPGPVQVAWRSSHGIQDLAAVPNPFAGGSWTYTLDPDLATSTLQISEFMASNRRTLNDRFGDDSDWIELFNSGTEPVYLQGWRLTDSATALGKWVFPSVSLAAKSYLLVFASGRDLTNASEELHTNFKLNDASGYLALVSPAGKVVSSFGSTYPPQQTDVSYGRATDDPQVVGYLLEPTPGGPNAVSGPGFAPAVQFSVDAGTFTQPFTLTLTPEVPTPGAVIRYTTDGSPVDEFSPVYAGPLTITQTTHVRARAFATGLFPGPMKSEVYFALSQDVANFATDLPILILHNNGGGDVPAYWDQPVMLQAFEPIGGETRLTNRPSLSAQGIFHLRGSSTLYYPKGSFFLETQDEWGFDRKVSLLDLPAESDWVLYAPNNFEPVLLHNPVAFALSRQMGQYASRTRFAVVFLNTAGGPVTAANYHGIYVLQEKIKIDDHRVAIDKLQPQHTQPPDVTGGYLVSVDREVPGESPFYAGGQWLNYLDPGYWEMTSPERAAQEQYLTSYLNAFYSALTGSQWNDPTTGYAAYIDVAEALDHHIQGVVTFNVDALRLSGYLYKPRNGKIVMGPVWDFDRTQGSTDGRDFNPRLWRSTVFDYGTDMFNAGNTYANPWYSRMFQDIDFWQRWVDRYQELRDGALSTTNVHALIDALAEEVRREQPREVVRWGIRPRSGTISSGGYAHQFPGTYQGEVDWMKQWYHERLDFIDDNLLGRPLLSLPGGNVSTGAVVTITRPESGTIYYTLDGSDPRATGGGIAPGARTYTGAITLTANARLVARAHDPNHRNLTGPGNPPLTTPWSGVTAATYVVSTPPLVISEVMYHPAAAPAGNTNAADNFEFIELLNRGSQALNLLGFHFTNGITFVFTATNSITQLAPGERLVVVKNGAAFQGRYPGVTRIAGEYVGSLDNGGERLTLVGPLLEPVLDFSYSDTWYPVTDGLGFSLVVRDESVPPSAWGNRVTWRASSQRGGSPAAVDPAPPAIPNVVINEALTHTDPPARDSVELRNLDAQPANIGGWWLTDDLAALFKFQIPTNTILQTGQFVVFTETDFTNSPASTFRLSSLGDEMYLVSTDGGTNLTGWVHGFEYGAAKNGVSFGRHVISTGDEHFVAQTEPTLGGTNRGPRVGPVVINELLTQAAPEAGLTDAALDEFVELRSVTNQPVTLYDPLAPTNTWRIRGGIDYDFPTNVVLGPHEYLLLVGFNPVAYPAKLQVFRDHYGLLPTARVLGPFQGRLAQAGDRLRLYQPDTPQGPQTPTPAYVPYVLVDAVDYANTPPWPTNTGTAAFSLQRRDGALYGNDPAQWEIAAPTPAAVNPSHGSADADSDGLPDAWEQFYGLSPASALGEHGASGDPDGDGLTNADELESGTHPGLADSDGDGLFDGWEVTWGLNPQNRDAVHGGLGDPDADGLSNATEQAYNTDPRSADTDADQLPDAWEVANGLDPRDGSGDAGPGGDPDQDGLTNLQEYVIGTRPLDPASSLRVQISPVGADRIRLYFVAAAGRAYALERSPAVRPGAWESYLGFEVQPQDSPVELITGVDPSRTWFYRLVLQLTAP
jgi:hypothetical protein